MASGSPNVDWNFIQKRDGFNLFKPIFKHRALAEKCMPGSIVMTYDCKGTGYNNGAGFQDPLKWVSFDSQIQVSSHSYVFESDQRLCAHCGKAAKCILFGPPNGQQHWLCPECARRKMEMIRARYFTKVVSE